MQTTAPPIPTPRKSRRRWYAIAGFLALVVATPYFVMLISEWQRDRVLELIYAELDAEDPHWRWADLVARMPAPPPDERNAAVQMTKVLGLLKGRYPRTNSPNYHNVRLADDSAVAINQRLSSAGEDALVEARKLKDMPDGRIVVKFSEDPFASIGPPRLKWLEVFDLLRDDAVSRAQNRDLEGAAESCQALLHAVHGINDFPELMAQLVREAGRDAAVNAIERTLAHGEVSEERLESLQNALIDEAEFNLLYHAWRGERAAAHHGYLQVRAGKPSPYHGVGRPAGVQERITEMFPSLYLNGYPDNLRIMNSAIRASQLPDLERGRTLGELNTKADNALANAGIFDVYTTTSFYLLGLVPQDELTRARLHCAIVAIAAERYRLKHETWPSGVDDLVKTGMLKKTYTDPYDGQPLHWKKTAENLIIYSVGPTKLDDGGKLDRFNARPYGFVLWVPAMRGLPAPPPEKPAK